MKKPFPNLYDFFMSPLERWKFQAIRKKILIKAKGMVLEIGSGTGINFPLYSAAERVVAIEPNQSMINQSRPKLECAAVPIEIIKTSGEHLPFKDHTFDTVVATLVLCTIPNPEKALNEMIRVCKPGGSILMFEHVKMENRFFASVQNWLTPVWKRIFDGCCLNRDTVSLIKKQGLLMIEMKSYVNGLLVIIELKNTVTR